MLDTLANGRVGLFIEPTNLFMFLGPLGFFTGNHVGQKLQAARRRRSVMGFPIIHLSTEWIGLLGHDCLLQKRRSILVRLETIGDPGIIGFAEECLKIDKFPKRPTVFMNACQIFEPGARDSGPVHQADPGSMIRIKHLAKFDCQCQVGFRE